MEDIEAMKGASIKQLHHSYSINVLHNALMGELDEAKYLAVKAYEEKWKAQLVAIKTNTENTIASFES